MAASVSDAQTQIGQPASTLIDGCGRRIDHLRMSVTDRCGMRCRYCRPARNIVEHDPVRDRSDKERRALVRFLHRRYQLTQVRITGGEPLLYRSLPGLIAGIRKDCPSISIAMTTNAQRLAPRAVELRQAGLDRLNVSLDALDPGLYRQITGGCVAGALEGIEAAVAAGFPPPKINTVVLRGCNDEHLIEMIDWAMRRRLELRFLEAMPIGPAASFNRAHFVSMTEVLERVASVHTLEPIGRAGTAERYRVLSSEQAGVIGLIAPVTRPFCSDCRRIRVTADGRLYPCLLDDRCVDLCGAFRGGDIDELHAARLLEGAIYGKLARGPGLQSTGMIQLGG